MKVQELGIEEMARLGATHRVVIKAEDLNGVGTGFGALSASAAANTTGTLIPFDDLPAGTQIAFVAGYLKTAFDGTTTTNLTLTLGYDLASGTDKSAGFLLALELHNDATEILYFPLEYAAATGTYAAVDTNALQTRISKVFSVACDITALFTATAANLTDLLTGEVHLYFRVVDLNKAA
ncbi:MAG: hypothetical protein ABIO94_11925 [Opitutaceae bacterium]